LIALKYEIQQFKKQYAANPSSKTVYSIVNCSSIVSLRSASAFGHYSASKAALDSIVKTAAIENGLNPTIRINSVLPGPVATDALGWTGKSQQEVFEPFVARTLFKRTADTSEIAKPVVFFLSEDASYITGALLLVDAGSLLI